MGPVSRISRTPARRGSSFAKPETDVYRVVLVAGNPDRIRFRVAMDDVRRPGLTVTTVEAVDDNNAPITDLSGITIEFNR